MVFITEVESVYCAVRSVSPYVKQIRFVFKGLMSSPELHLYFQMVSPPKILCVS
jgi:hypothetical protein